MSEVIEGVVNGVIEGVVNGVIEGVVDGVIEGAVDVARSQGGLENPFPTVVAGGSAHFLADQGRVENYKDALSFDRAQPISFSGGRRLCPFFG